MPVPHVSDVMKTNRENYIRHQKSFDVRVGDIVTVFRKPSLDEWPWSWVSEMNGAIGKSGKVLEISEDGILIKIPGIVGSKYQQDAWYYPYTCLNIIR